MLVGNVLLIARPAINHNKINMIVDELPAQCGCGCGGGGRGSGGWGCDCGCGCGTNDASIAAAEAAVVAKFANVNTLVGWGQDSGLDREDRGIVAIAVTRAEVGGGCGCGGCGGGPRGRALLYCLGADHLHGAVGGAGLQHLQLFALRVLCAVRLWDVLGVGYLGRDRRESGVQWWQDNEWKIRGVGLGVYDNTVAVCVKY